MKTTGLIGGIAPESTIQYYRLVVAEYRERKRDGSYPPVIINSIDMTRMLDLIGAGRLTEVTDYLGQEIDKLSRAGASFGRGRPRPGRLQEALRFGLHRAGRGRPRA